jgi:hypothetical protein
MALLCTFMFVFATQPLIKFGITLSLALRSAARQRAKAAATGMRAAPDMLLDSGVREFRRMRDSLEWRRGVPRWVWAALIVGVIAMAVTHGGRSRADDVPAPPWQGSTAAPSSSELAVSTGAVEEVTTITSLPQLAWVPLFDVRVENNHRARAAHFWTSLLDLTFGPHCSRGRRRAPAYMQGRVACQRWVVLVYRGRCHK